MIVRTRETNDNLINLTKFQNFLYRLKKNKNLNENVYQEIRPIATSTPTLYGLPKIHKENHPLRPILASVGSYTYQSAKWLNKVLEPLRQHPTVVKDSFEFANKISEIKNLQNYTLVSFDVKSLFTNIPVDFTINLILEKLFPENSTLFYDMTKKQFKKLLNWTCKSSTFQFNGKFYKQLDGVAMGSPLAPALADICMNWILNSVMKNSKESFVVYRYVDDLFLAFKNQKDINRVFKSFNSINSRIKFTKEIEIENQLPFLDIHLNKTSKNVETKVYKKPTHTGSYTKWDSYVQGYHFVLISKICAYFQGQCLTKY